MRSRHIVSILALLALGVSLITARVEAGQLHWNGQHVRDALRRAVSENVPQSGLSCLARSCETLGDRSPTPRQAGPPPWTTPSNAATP